MPILHRTRTLPALLPRYVSRFGCIGPACEETCCYGWQVSLDKKTYKSYRQSTHPALAARFADNVSRVRSGADDSNYGRIDIPAASQACPMLDGGLCAVHKELDESHLSHTCFTYPRVSREVGGQFEQALVLSCPEAARQALLAPDAFEFEEGTIAVRAEVVGAAVARHGLPLELMNELRIFCLALMRTEGLELWQRLAVLGVFCESLAGLIAAGQASGVRTLLDNFVALLEQGQLLDALAPMQPDHSAQALVFATLWGGQSFTSGTPKQTALVRLIARGLGADASGRASDEQLVASYSRGLGRLQEALREAPHLLDHFILNEMFMRLFPFDGEDVFDSYLQLVSRFGLLRLMLAARCNAAEALPGPAELVETTYLYCRRFQHDVQFATRVNQALKHSAWNRLDKLYAFLRA